MKTLRIPHVPTADEAATIVSRRRAAEKRALERREARRQARLATERAADEARAAARLAPRPGFYAEAAMLPGALAEIAVRGIARLALGAARALRRAYVVRRETRAASVLGLPTPSQIAAAWVPPRRSLAQALTIGSKLVDLSAAHPGDTRWNTDPATGARRIVGRDGGLKRWFAEYCPTIRYTTAMRYRQLALRLLRVLGTPAAIPLEWVLSGTDPGVLTANAALADAIRDGRRKLADLLADIRSQRELTRSLDRILDPDRLPNARRNSDPLRDAAASQAVIDRFDARLRAAAASGKPLSGNEKAALALLKRLDRLTGPP